MLTETLNAGWTMHQHLGVEQEGTLKVDQATRDRLRALGYGDECGRTGRRRLRPERLL